MPYEIQQMSHRHHAVLDWMLLNPDRPLKHCSADLGYTKEWIYALVHTDAFQAELAQRRKQLENQVIAGVHKKMAEATDRALDIVIDALSTDDCDAGYAFAVADKGMKHIGASKDIKQTNVQTNVQVNESRVTQNVLARGRELIRAFGAPKESAAD